MDQQKFHITSASKPDITADLFRTSYPDISLQPLEKNTSDIAKSSKQQQHRSVGTEEEEEEEEEDGEVEDEEDARENTRFVQSQLTYQQQQTVLQKVHLSLPVQTTPQIPQQYRLEQNGVIIQPHSLMYARYTTNNDQLILQQDTQPKLQAVVVSNTMAEPSKSAKQIPSKDENEVDGQKTINCSIQCINTQNKKPQNNTQQWIQKQMQQHQQQQQLSREKAKSSATIPTSPTPAVKKSPAKRQPNKEVKKKDQATIVKEKPTNVVMPMYQTTKGQVVTTKPKLQIPQTSPVAIANVPQNLLQPQQQTYQITQAPLMGPPPPPSPSAVAIPAVRLPIQHEGPAEVPGTQIVIIMPDKTQRMISLNPQNKDYKIHEIVNQLGYVANEITINVKVKAPSNDEDLEEENQREMEEMNAIEAEAANHQQSQDQEEDAEAMAGLSESDDQAKEHPNEQPLYRAGYLAVCNFCGYSSNDFNRCQRCNRKFPVNIRSVSASSVMKATGNSPQKVSRKTKCHSPLDSENSRKKPKGSGKKKKLEEPVCLTISDDEEAANNESQDRSQVMQSRMDQVFVTDPVANLSATQKEPVITDDMSSEDTGASEAAVENFPEEEIEDECTRLHCRTVRIGSYKVVPHEKVLLSPLGIKIYVPALDNTPVTVTILFHEIVRVLIHFHKSLPVLFFYTNPTAAKRIREILKMVDVDCFYYDPTSKVDAHKRITLLPEILDEDNRLFLKHIFGNSSKNKPLLVELNSKEANYLLVRASPKDVQETLGKRNSIPPPLAMAPTTFNGGIHTIMVYPPPPTKGGIPINTEDYACLGEDQFLNDVIIDFYLKYLVLTQLSEADQARTHVFSSFFYKRLTTRPPKATRRTFHPIEDDPTIAPAVKRHSRVKSWTKAVDLFSKDFIIIPINENCHWYLAIVCFPGLQGPVRISDNAPINLPDKKKKDDGDVTGMTAKVFSGKQAITIGSTTITAVVNVVPSNQTVTIDTAPNTEEEDRDEADGEDEDMESNHSSDNESEDSSKSKLSVADDEKDVPIAAPEEKKSIKRIKQEREPIKQPCILIFDSLAGGSRARVVATLRDYLRIEYKTKQGEERDFSKDVMKGASPKVPQQTNYTDCGLYLLQYVESFFQMPIKDYHIPIKELLNWFTADLVSQKRYQIQQLLHHLMEEQKIDIESLNLPNLRLKEGSPKGQLVDYSCSEEEEEVDEEEEMDVDEHMDEDLCVPGELGEEEELEEEEEIGEEGMVEGMSEDMCEEEEDYNLDDEEEEPCDEEDLEEGEINPDDIPEPLKQRINLKSVRVQRVDPIQNDLISPRKKHRSSDK